MDYGGWYKSIKKRTLFNIYMITPDTVNAEQSESERSSRRRVESIDNRQTTKHEYDDRREGDIRRKAYVYRARVNSKPVDDTQRSSNIIVVTVRAYHGQTI